MNKRLEERKSDFFNALRRLKEALAKNIEDDIIIDGIMQRFEFTFEQSWKVMKIYIEDQGITDEALAPRSTIRAAVSQKIISNGDKWIEMMLDRNRTSHMYDEKTAREIVENIKRVYVDQFEELKDFLEEQHKLIQ